MADPNSPEGEVKIGKEAARQGTRPKSMIAVLAVSVVLTIIAFIAISMAVATPDGPPSEPVEASAS